MSLGVQYFYGIVHLNFNIWSQSIVLLPLFCINLFYDNRKQSEAQILSPCNGSDSPINSTSLGHVCRVFYIFPNQTLLQHHIATKGIITGCLDSVELE